MNRIGNKKNGRAKFILAGMALILLLGVRTGESCGTYQWHTFYGGTATDRGQALALGNIGDVYITGYSEDSWNGVSEKPPLHAYAGGRDVAVLCLEPTTAGSGDSGTIPVGPLTAGISALLAWWKRRKQE